MEPDHRIVPHLSLLIYKTSIWKDGDSRRPDLSIASKLTEDACSCCSVWQARCRYNNLIGLAPSGMRQGDLVCISYGCSVPVIPRLAAGTSTGSFGIAGEAYISFYDGETLDDRRLQGKIILF